MLALALVQTSFSEKLAQKTGMPFINLSRGAAGPKTYTDRVNVDEVDDLLKNAHTVVINVMSGRSSENSEYKVEPVRLIVSDRMQMEHRPFMFGSAGRDVVVRVKVCSRGRGATFTHIT